MRKFIVKHYALDYMTKLFGMSVKFTRSASIIYPNMILIMLSLVLGFPITSIVLGLTLLVNVFFGFWYFELKPLKFSELKDMEQKFQFGAGQFSNQLSKGKPKLIHYFVPYCMLLILWFGLNLGLGLIENILAVLVITASLLATYLHKSKMDRTSFGIEGMDMEEFNRAQDYVDEIDLMKNYKPWRFIYHPFVATFISVSLVYLVSLLK